MPSPGLLPTWTILLAGERGAVPDLAVLLVVAGRAPEPSARPAQVWPLPDPMSVASVKVPSAVRTRTASTRGSVPFAATPSPT